MSGNTKAVAEYIANATGGKAIDVKNVPQDISGYDTIIIGSRIHAGKVSKKIQGFVESQRDKFVNKKVGFFICGMFSGDKGDKQLVDASEALGIAYGKYFVGGKKLVKEPAPIDEFIAGITTV